MKITKGVTGGGFREEIWTILGKKRVLERVEVGLDKVLYGTNWSLEG